MTSLLRLPAVALVVLIGGAATTALAQPPVPLVPGLDPETLRLPGEQAAPPPGGRPPVVVPPGMPDVPGFPGLPDPGQLPPTAAPAGSVEDQLQRARDELDQLMREDVDGLVSIDLPEGWPDLSGELGLPAIRAIVQPADRPVRVRLAPLSVTTIQLASSEQVVDCVIGDAVFFEVQCGDNLVYIKGAATDRRTRLTVSTLTDRLYAFDLFAHQELPPDHILRVAWPESEVEGDPFAEVLGRGPAAAGASSLPPIGQRESSFTPGAVPIVFESAGRVAALEAEIAAAERELAALSEQSAEELVRMQILRDERLAEYLERYPRRVEPRYRLSPEIQLAPIFISQIWTDGRFTYLRSHSQESPVLFEITGVNADEELLVNYQLSPEGLFVVDHVVAAGYAQLHGSRGEWYEWDVPPLSVINQSSGLELPDIAPDWRRTLSQRSWFVRHKKLTWFMAVAGSAYVGLGYVNAPDGGAFCWKMFC